MHVNRWLVEPITRAEAIGWALTIPALVFIGLVGTNMVRLLPSVGWLAEKYPDLTPTFLILCLRMGAGGLIAVFSFCAVVPLGAQLSRQRPLVRVAAPLVCALLVHAASSQFIASWGEMAKLANALYGPTATQDSPR